METHTNACEKGRIYYPKQNQVVLRRIDGSRRIDEISQVKELLHIPSNGL